MFGRRVVPALFQIRLHLVLHLGFIQMPGVLLPCVLTSSGVWGPWDLVDRRRLLQDLVRETLGSWKHLSKDLRHVKDGVIYKVLYGDGDMYEAS